MTRIKPDGHIAERAGEYFSNGFHCTESVVAAATEVLAHIDHEQRETAITCATCFGGGFGKSFAETCGVISGGLIVIGLLYGRSKHDQSWDTPAALADQFRNTFLQKHDTTHCGTLRERFGEEKQMLECQNLVREGVTELLHLLHKYQENDVLGGKSSEIAD